MNKSNTQSQQLMVEWNKVKWRKLERQVFKLQKRIHQASKRGDIKTVRKLEKTLIKSWSAKMLAVRKVTQDNQGKKTAGVDGIKSLNPTQRIQLVSQLKLGDKAKSTRRVWIPKPGKDEKRPLGIPTMYDRALQALVKLALEPEWEAIFEPNSYGFRPGRSCHDAIGAIYGAIKQKAKYVLDADISKCFDCINQEALLAKIKTFPRLKRQIKAWLKSGVMDGGQLFPTNEGTPQGGVISPLLANIALHGMENRIKQAAEKLPGSKRDNQWATSLIRYADDFVIIHKNKDFVIKCQQIIADWLKDMGLELKPEKTQLVHTFEGFDFLGFNIRQYKVGKYRTGYLNGNPLGFKTIIKPSKDKITRHYRNIANVIDTHKTAPQGAIIGKLNPIIKGWANYYSGVCSKEIYSALDSLTYQKLSTWAKRRHPNKSINWVIKKYWGTIGQDNWVFKDNKGNKLIKYAETRIIRHVKVKGESSPYDGDFIYWSRRNGEHPEIPQRVAKLLKVQKGKCAHCGLYFREGDLMEVDHIIPKSKGGKDEYKNWQLLHRHCHDRKTTTDTKGIHDKEQVIEEPDEAKVSRPVLKPSRKGDLPA